MAERPASQILRLSHLPEMQSLWNVIVQDHLTLYRFAKTLSELTARHGLLQAFPEEALRALFASVNFRGPEEQLRYDLGVITLNMASSHLRSNQRESELRFNLLFLVAMQRAGVPPDVLSLAQNRALFDAIPSKKDLGLAVTRQDFSKLHDFRKMLDELMESWTSIQNHEVQARYRIRVERAWESWRYWLEGQLELDDRQKQTLLDNMEGLLFQILPDPQIPFHAIAETRYGQGRPPRVVVMEEYRPLFEEAFLPSPPLFGRTTSDHIAGTRCQWRRNTTDR